MSRRLVFSLPLVFLLAGPAAAPAAPGPDGLRLEPSSTRIGVARVTLRATDLVYRGGRLLGTYLLEIPLAPMLDDHGTLQLPIEGSLDRLLERGGRVVGSGSSAEDGRTHRILCDFRPGGAVEITVETPSRRLRFATRITGAGAAEGG